MVSLTIFHITKALKSAIGSSNGTVGFEKMLTPHAPWAEIQILYLHNAQTALKHVRVTVVQDQIILRIGNRQALGIKQYANLTELAQLVRNIFQNEASPKSILNVTKR